MRKGGDTKTRKSRRTLALAQRCVAALVQQRALQDRERVAAADRWREHGLVFATTLGTPLDSSHVRRDFRVAIRGANGVDPKEWTPRELRHSFVSLLSDQGMPLEDISRLVGNACRVASCCNLWVDGQRSTDPGLRLGGRLGAAQRRLCMAC